MPNLRELRSRIRSIESTSRVTKALQMIAAAKMKKAQDKVLEGRAYSCLLYTSPSPRDKRQSRMPSSA